MMKRLVLPGYLFFLLCICTWIASPVNAQDTITKVEAEKKVEPEKKSEPDKIVSVNPVTAAATTSTVTTPRVRPVTYHYRKSPQSTANNDSGLNVVDSNRLNDKSLNGQYQYLLTKVYRYQQPFVAALWKSVTDSMNAERNQFKNLQIKLSAQTQTINSLKSAINNNTQGIAESTVSASKSSLNTVLWILVVGLTMALVAVILSIGKYKHEAKHRAELYEEIDEEYKAFKVKANEKEIKLARELQTERNKLDELLGRG